MAQTDIVLKIYNINTINFQGGCFMALYSKDVKGQWYFGKKIGGL
jgi:hypothetical protein